MLSARRKYDGETVLAYLERKSNGPFACLDCGEEMILKAGRRKINYFAHANPLAHLRAENEGDEHRRCKMEIYEALRKEPCVRDATLERSFGPMRADIFSVINDVQVAIEVQISSLSVQTIMDRTIWYHRKGIYVLWLLQWTPKLDSPRYIPKIWEKWIHAAYFGNVYYWLGGINVVSYHFDASLRSIPRSTWFSENGKRMTVGGYTRKSKRFRVPIRGRTLDLVRDFGPRERLWWEGGGLKVPDARIFMECSSFEDVP